MNIITIITSPKTIIYNDNNREFEFDIPSVFPSNFFCLYWWEHEQKYEYWIKEENGQIKINTLQYSEEVFNSYIQPFIDIFLAYKPSEKEIRSKLTEIVRLYLDDTVAKKDYDNILTACSYCNSTNPIFANDAKICIEWRDNVWETFYNILAEILAGNRSIPTDKELIAELPTINW